MGYPTDGIGTHYGDTSIVDDVTPIIFQITPEDTPVKNMLTPGSASAVTHEWQTRSITTRSDNAAPEGSTYNFTGANQLPGRKSNVQQILKKEVRVSGTTRAAGHHAIGDLASDQMATELTGLMTDLEHTLIQGTGASGSATDTARRMDGLVQVISTYGTTHTTVTNISLTEEHFNDFQELMWDLGASPKDWLMKGTLKRRISSFTANSTSFIERDQRRQVNTVAIYESDFGVVQLHLSRDIPGSATNYGLLGLDRTMLTLAMLRPFISKRTADIADSYDGIILGEATLEYGNALGHFYADGLR